MQKQFLLIPCGIVLIIIGFYIASYSLNDVDIEGRSLTEQRNVLISTDYPIGVGFVALGITCIGTVIIWKYKSSNKKHRQ